MNDIEKTVRQFHVSRDLRDPERGVAVIAEDCRFEDIARSEAQTGPDDYPMEYNRRRTAFPDGEVKVVNVITGADGWAVVAFLTQGTQTVPLHSSLGEFPPSGRKTEVRCYSDKRVQGGKAVEGRDDCDSASIARQPGLAA